MNFILRSAYLEENEALRKRADKVRFHNEQKRAAHSYRAELRRAKRSLEGGARGGRVRVNAVVLAPDYRPGVKPISSQGPEDTNIDSVVDDLAGITVLCNRVEEEESAAGADLLNALQKQSEIYELLSKVSTTMHDTMKSAINNVR